ncbi:hypothetical protein UO65_2522 [Actinokineospora spheciospongiae]|uniref:VCBS repeat-containing protein n=1 Tax=Actinokineospora spheciospongiae TaxID=909613 RepID=W7IZZ6_9PSEU|nr:hypothetical protein [Actinokineospora spheciospongiae]EWC62156.1 hypothetical protein UO65_2522 [Actinokineospora spheciospongiae]PWW65856.1 hypothetical protein DFQ13_102614 [Actinokineospora spheciospongiae]
MRMLPTSRATAGLIAAGLISLVGAVPALAAPSVTARADLNGDGTAETITLTTQTDGTEQLLSATVGGQTRTLVLPLSSADGAQPIRVVDINKDRKAELLVTESTGDGTTTFNIVDLGTGGFRVATTPDGQALRFFEGGGPGARSGYTCKEFFGTREFTILFAVASSSAPNPDFIGTLASYRFANGVATPSSQIPIFGVKGDNPQLVVNPSACNA